LIALRLVTTPGFGKESFEEVQNLQASFPLPRKKVPWKASRKGSVIHIENTNLKESLFLLQHLYGFRDFLYKGPEGWISSYNNKAYIRGIKSPFPTAAPIPEDLAYHCIKESFRFAQVSLEDSYLAYIPFAGTMTFATELALIQSKYPYTNLPKPHPFVADHPELTPTLKHLTQSTSHRSRNFNKILMLDSDPALESYFLTEKRNWENFLQSALPWYWEKGSFFSYSPDFEDYENIFIPINPPFGNRKMQRQDRLYERLAIQLANWISIFPKKLFFGAILSKNKEDWSNFLRKVNLANTKTVHATHGGDLRITYFVFGENR